LGRFLTLPAVTVGECLGDDPANWYRGGSVSTNTTTTTTTTGATSTGPSISTTSGTSGKGGSPPGGAPSGSPKGSGVPVWTNTPPTTAQGWGGWKPSGGSKGGDTEPGHGVNAGRGALPGCQGQGNNPVPGYNGSTGGYSQGGQGGKGGQGGPSGSATGAVSGHGSRYVSSNRHQFNANSSSNSSNPAYYVNGAGSLSVSAAMLVGAAVLGLFL
jgi:hypothetical protein